MIHFQQVTKRYANGQEGLVDIDLQVAKGQMVFVTGHSGAGKSTLLKLIALIERPTHGQIKVSGQHLNRLTQHQIPYYRRHIGIVFQNHGLLWDRSVYENVSLPMVIAGHGAKETGKRVRAALDKVGLLDREHCYPIDLSGGEQQRVGIARAVVNRPTLLLADEPTGNLDPQLSAEVMELFHRFNQVGVTVLVATHALDLISRFQHQVLVLKDGRVTAQ